MNYVTDEPITCHRIESGNEVTMKNRVIAEVLSQQFGLQGEFVSLRPIGNGHINTTMLLKNKQRALVVQKLNTCVFPEPEQLVTNARKIEQHLARKANDGGYELAIIRHVPTVKGEYLVHFEDEVWRALEFIGGSYSEDVVDSEVKATVAANAFGQFAAALDDFDATQLHHVIPNFHNLAMRIEKFEETLRQDPQSRAARCQEEIAFCRAQFSLAQEVIDVEAQLPLRACHNDTKINNMLFCSESNNARAVIDLDTCMPGYWLYDFGDMVRTFCSPEAEDSTNLANVRVREEIFAALVKGYKGPLSASLTETEKHSFILGAKVMPFMIGLRFLTDYLDGDNYFATKHSEHNLQRAQNQFALYQDIVAKETQLSAIISEL